MFGLSPLNLTLERDHRADRLALVHQIEGIVDLLNRHHVSDEIIDVDLLVHVPVDDARHLGAATNAAECRAAPVASGDQLERPGADFLARARDADNDRRAPATMTTLEGLAHQVHVANTLEAVVGAAVRQLDEMRHQVAFELLRVDEVGHAELLGHRLALRVDVDTDDLVGADHLGALDHVQADSAEAEDHNIGARLNLRGLDDGTDTGGHAAADVTNFLEWFFLANVRH